MKYDNISCPVCGKTFENEFDVVVCPECGTPHHRDCFNSLGHCINEEKHSDTFSWEAPETTPIIDVKAKVAESESQKDLRSEELGIICPRCGDNCPKGTEICPNCGQKLSENPEEFTPDSTFKMYPETSAFTFNSISPEDTIDDIPVRETATFLQFGSQQYLRKFLNMEKLNKKVSWSWGAFIGTLLFCPYWFIKKKLYGAGAVFGAIFLALNAVFQPISVYVADIISSCYPTLQKAIEDYGAGSQQAIDASYACLAQIPHKFMVVICLYYVAIILMAIIAGLIGTSLYKKKVKKEILAAREQTDDIHEYYYLLNKKGKNNFLLAMLVWILVALLSRNLFATFPIIPFLK